MDDRTIDRLASIELAIRLGRRRRQLDRRIEGFAAKYAPMLARLSATEWLGLVQAVAAEIDRRESANVIGQALRETAEREGNRQ